MTGRMSEELTGGMSGEMTEEGMSGEMTGGMYGGDDRDRCPDPSAGLQVSTCNGYDLRYTLVNT